MNLSLKYIFFKKIYMKLSKTMLLKGNSGHNSSTFPNYFCSNTNIIPESDPPYQTFCPPPIVLHSFSGDTRIFDRKNSRWQIHHLPALSSPVPHLTALQAERTSPY